MTRLAVLAIALLLCTGAAAQHAPLVINNDTVGELRMRQVGALILPSGPPSFPAVVVLHGCNGVSPNTQVWARRLASWGYAALILDSFTSRRIANVCGHGLDLSGRERAKDALAAAAYLRTRADIDPDHIGLLGYSHGGWSAIAAAREQLVAESGTKPFTAIVAYYPSCPPGAPKLATDVQILTGDADDWAPVKRCTDLLARYPEGAPHRPLLKIYPGALHSFDANRPERVYFGHKLGYDAKAAADSFQVTKQFLGSRLRR